MQKKRPQLTPTTLETWGVAFVSIVLVLLGNAHDLLQRYGLIPSSDLVKSRLSHGVGSGLARVDSFTITRSAVTFAVWGVVGLVSFSFVQTLVGASGRFKYRKQLGSNQYVHPANFSRKGYWRSIVSNTVASFLLLLAAVAGAVAYVLFVIPVSFDYSRRFLLHVQVTHLPDLLVGLATMFVGSYVLYVLVKLLAWQHRASRV